MNIWDRLRDFSSATPFTGTWMSVGTAVVALCLVLGFRRLLPQEDRHHGRVTAAFLFIALVMGLLRLALVAVGAGSSGGGKALSFFTTFFVATGAMGMLLMLLFEVAPARLKVKLPSILRDIVQLVGFGIVLIGVLSQSGIDVIPMITTAGVTAAIIGFALQNTIANLFAGLVLHMDRALGVGDWVQVGTRVGCITQIRWRSTILRTTDGDTVIIPNGTLTAQEVYNFSRPNPRHRHWIRVGFHYRHAPNDVCKVLVEAARSAPGVLSEPLPDAFPVDFADSAVVYAVRVWIDQFHRRTEIEGEMRTRIWYAARRAGLEIPFPTRTVHTHQESAEKARNAGLADLQERADALTRVDLFAALEPADRELLARGMKDVAFGASEIIIRQGEPGDSLFLISRGLVRVSIGQGDLNTSVANLGPGQFFGEMSLMTGEPRSATCIAASDVLCHVIDHAGFQQLLTMRPHVAEQMSSVLAARQAALGRKGDELSARAAQTTEVKTKLLAKIRSFFDLG